MNIKTTLRASDRNISVELVIRSKSDARRLTMGEQRREHSKIVNNAYDGLRASFGVKEIKVR